MNEYIAKYLKDKINETGITYRNVSKKTGIEYTQWREAEPGVLFQESVRRGGKLHAEIVKNKSVRA